MASPISTTFLRSLALLLAAATLAPLARSSAGEPRPESDRVTGLPGQPPVGFRHYAGYVGVGPGDDKALFYWFFEADERPDEKPLVLWLNGGPGCSSVAYGAVQELGPFLARNKANLTLNPYAWNKAANLLFLESPVGVGFSYSNRSSDLQELGDRVTAQDSYAFLLNWFRRFPGLRPRDFYIAGESYAGHYIPQLAELIFERNKAAGRESHINLKGFMMGNAVMNDATDQQGMVEYAWSHAIISDELHDAISENCGSFDGDDEKEEGRGGNRSKGCSTALRAFLKAYSDIDIYSIYTPVCLSALSRRQQERLPDLVAGHRIFSQHDYWHGMVRMRSGYDPCTEDYVEKYFNREDVQRALHANLTHLSYPYSSCSGIIQKWNDAPSTVLPIVKKLMNAGLRIWVYSGDTDGRVPVTSTRYSINKMGLTPKEEGWRAWYYKEQVAGWVVEYEEGLTFATVRGAGHQVPVFAPDRSLSLFSHFLTARPLPSSRFH